MWVKRCLVLICLLVSYQFFTAFTSTGKSWTYLIDRSYSGPPTSDTSVVYTACTEYLPKCVFEPKLFSVTAENIDSDHHYDPKGMPNGLDIERLPALKYAVEHMRAIDLPRIEEGKTCVVVGSSGILNEFNIGKVIDGYDYVFRFNDAPVQGYENKVGNRTTFRVTYYRAAKNGLLHGSYQSDHFIFALTLARELTPLAYFLDREFYKQMNFSTTDLKDSDKTDTIYSIMNEFFNKNTFTLLSPYLSRNVRTFAFRKGMLPTAGMLGLVLASRVCPEPPDLAGFTLGQSNSSYHYYGKGGLTGVHDGRLEKDLIQKMVECGMLGRHLTDPTNTGH